MKQLSLSYCLDTLVKLNHNHCVVFHQLLQLLPSRSETISVAINILLVTISGISYKMRKTSGEYTMFFFNEPIASVSLPLKKFIVIHLIDISFSLS